MYAIQIELENNIIQKNRNVVYDLILKPNIFAYSNI